MRVVEAVGGLHEEAAWDYSGGRMLVRRNKWLHRVKTSLRVKMESNLQYDGLGGDGCCAYGAYEEGPDGNVGDGTLLP